MRSKTMWLLVALLSLPLVILPSSAHAASIYDTTYKSMTTLIQKGYYGCSDQDITYTWSNYLTDDEFSGVKDSFETATSEGRWGVSVSYGQVQVFWTEDTSLYLDWTDPTYGGGYSVIAKGNDVHRAEFSLSGYYSPKPCMPYVSSYSTDNGAQMVISDKFGYNKNLFVMTDYPNYPTGYEGGSVIDSEPKATYVALGDSFSSGEGNPAFEPGTNINGVNECHRSPQAYPRLLQTELDLGSTAFAACSGATTASVLYGGTGSGNWGESPQVDTLSDETEVITITIGGNDIGFADYAYACTIMLCGPSTFDYGYIMGAINDPDFFDSLVLTYETILESAPNAEVYVIDYPYLADDSSDVCGAMDLTGVWAVQSQLNGVIEEAVSQVITDHLNLRLHYVNTNQTNSPFIGKHLCNGGDSDFNGLSAPFDREYSFHPNMFGQQHYADVVKSKM